MGVYLWQGIILGFSAAMLPGAMQAFLIQLAMKEGWRRAVPATIAPLITDGPIIVVMLFLLQTMPPLLLQGIRLVGGLFLLYLAWGAWQSFRGYRPNLTSNSDLPSKSIGQAVLVNFLNPNPYLFWSTVGGVALLDAWRSAPIHGAGFLVGMYGTLTLAFVGMVVGVGKMGEGNQGLGRILILISAIALFAFAIYQLSCSLASCS